MQSPACGAFAFIANSLNPEGAKDPLKTQKRENSFFGFSEFFVQALRPLRSITVTLSL
jgi:hypothetical protein